MYMKTNPKLWNVVLIYLNTTFKSTLRNSTKFELNKSNPINPILAFKDGSYYYYCAHVLRISRYSDFLSAELINTGYFCVVQNYAEKAELSKCSWYPKRKLGVIMHFSEKNKLQFGKGHHTLLCILKLSAIIVD